MTTPRFTITRDFAAPRQRLWDAWTHRDQLDQWFGPKGSQGETLAFDPRPGGEWRGRMEGPDGAVMFSKFVFREVTPIDRLVWVHGFADESGDRARAPFAALFPLELLTTVDFVDAGAGTRVTLTWVPIDASPDEEGFFASMADSMRGGWGGSFDQLDAFLAGQGSI